MLALGVTLIIADDHAGLKAARRAVLPSVPWQRCQFHLQQNAGGTYNVVDDEPLTKREYAEACAAAVGRRIWISGPGRLGLLLGDRLTSITRSLRLSNQRFRDASGWRPRYPSAAEGYRAMAQLR